MKQSRIGITWILGSLVLGAALGGCGGGGGSPLGSLVPTSAPTGPEQELYAAAAGEAAASAAGKYLVVFRDGVIPDPPGGVRGAYDASKRRVRAAIETKLRGKGVTAAIEQVYCAVFKGFSGRLTDFDRDRLARDPDVARVEADQVVRLILPPVGVNKPPGGGGGGTPPPAQVTPPGIARVGGPLDGTGRTAWIVDTGVDLDHPDLSVDTARARTFVLYGRDAANADDGNGHGTHVAGTIAARNNGIGVVGVAAGALVVPVKVLDSRGSGTYAAVVAGVDYVAASGAPGDAANLSLGGPPSQTLDDAVVEAAAAGIFFSLAAGNESDSAANHSPARANGPNVFTISAVDAADVFAWFSNFGNPPVDYAAPGVGVYSTWKGGTYKSISGTSMAAPHAAGALLLTGGTPGSSGAAASDPDGQPDPIITAIITTLP